MTYTPQMNSTSPRGGAYMIDQKDVEKILKSLMLRQSGGYSVSTLPEACHKASFEGWKQSQLEFSRRLAQITAKQAARQKARFTWKHRSIGLLRRLALIVMVASILAAQYI